LLEGLREELLEELEEELEEENMNRLIPQKDEVWTRQIPKNTT
jgi:hypothetical protein